MLRCSPVVSGGARRGYGSVFEHVFQGLVQLVATQRPGQLAQRRQAAGQLRFEETAVGGDQQDRRTDARTQSHQTVRAIRYQYVERVAEQAVVGLQTLVLQAPARQPGLQQLRQPAVGRALRDHPAAQRQRLQRRADRRQRQADAEQAAQADRRLHRQLALHGLAQLAREGQAEACAAVLAGDTRVGLGERLEDAIQRLLGDADAGVAHTDAHTSAVASTRTSTRPRRVNFSALDSRLLTTWRIRVGSPETWAGRAGSTRQVSSTPAAAFCERRLAVSSTRTPRSNGICSRPVARPRTWRGRARR